MSPNNTSHRTQMDGLRRMPPAPTGHSYMQYTSVKMFLLLMQSIGMVAAYLLGIFYNYELLAITGCPVSVKLCAACITLGACVRGKVVLCVYLFIASCYIPRLYVKNAVSWGKCFVQKFWRHFTDHRCLPRSLIWHKWYNWGEPERAPHRRDIHARIVYIYIYVWYDRHPRRRSYTIHCAHSKIFRAIQTACYNVCVLHCAHAQACNIHCHVFKHRSSYVCAS